MTSTKNQQFYDPPPTPSAKTNNRFIDSDSARIYGDRKPNSLKVFSLLFLFFFTGNVTKIIQLIFDVDNGKFYKRLKEFQ